MRELRHTNRRLLTEIRTRVVLQRSSCAIPLGAMFYSAVVNYWGEASWDEMEGG